MHKGGEAMQTKAAGYGGGGRGWLAVWDIAILDVAIAVPAGIAIHVGRT